MLMAQARGISQAQLKNPSVAWLRHLWGDVLTEEVGDAEQDDENEENEDNENEEEEEESDGEDKSEPLCEGELEEEEESDGECKNEQQVQGESDDAVEVIMKKPSAAMKRPASDAARPANECQHFYGYCPEMKMGFRTPVDKDQKSYSKIWKVPGIIKL